MGYSAEPLGVPARLRRRYRHLGRLRARAARRLARDPRLRPHRPRHGGQERRRHRRLRSLQLLPLGGRGGDEGDRHRRGRPAPDQRDRRPALLRRARQQLRHALDRRDGERGARQARLVRHGDGQRQLPHQALGRSVFDRADRGKVAAPGSRDLPGRARRRAEAPGGHQAVRHRNDRNLLRHLRQGSAGARLHRGPPRLLGRPLRRHGPRRPRPAHRHADARTTRA